MSHIVKSLLNNFKANFTNIKRWWFEEIREGILDMELNGNQNLTQKTISGIIWKLAERLGAQIVTLIVSIVLARLLLPED